MTAKGDDDKAKKGEAEGFEAEHTKPEDREDHSKDDTSEAKCPECGEPVYEKRATCPNCGYEYQEQDYESKAEGDEFSTVNEAFLEEDGEDGGGKRDDDGGEERDKEPDKESAER